jgi:HD superfamily phosphohydrolase
MDACNRGKIGIDELVKMGDEELLNRLRQAGGYAKELTERLKKRRLYKRVAEFNIGRIEGEAINAVFGESNSRFRGNPENILRLESFLAEKLGQEPGSILVDIPHRDEFEPPERNIKIWPSQEYAYQRSRYIYEIDSLYRELRKMRIYSKKKLSNGLKEKCEKIIREVAGPPSEADEIIEEYEPWILDSSCNILSKSFFK